MEWVWLKVVYPGSDSSSSVIRGTYSLQELYLNQINNFQLQQRNPIPVYFDCQYFSHLSLWIYHYFEFIYFLFFVRDPGFSLGSLKGETSICKLKHNNRLPQILVFAIELSWVMWVRKLPLLDVLVTLLLHFSMK